MARVVVVVSMAVGSIGRVLDSLPPRLVRVLASLDGAPRSVVEATVQLLPFGSRAALESTGCAEAGEVLDDVGHRPLRLTPLGYEVIAAAAARADQSVDLLAGWEARARQARSPRG